MHHKDIYLKIFMQYAMSVFVASYEIDEQIIIYFYSFSEVGLYYLDV